MTGGFLWGTGLVAAVFGPFFLSIHFAGWPDDPAAWDAAYSVAVLWSSFTTTVYAGLSVAGVLDWARYNAEIRAKRTYIDAPVAEARVRGHEEAHAAINAILEKHPEARQWAVVRHNPPMLAFTVERRHSGGEGTDD